MTDSFPIPPPPVLPQPGDRIAERYVVQREIGRGGMGAVFEAKHEVTGRQVAIKWMLPIYAQDSQAVSRFVREAKLAAAVDHENVVDIYDVGHQGSGFYLVMEFLRGRSLAERLEEGPMLLPELVSIMRGVCAGLAAAHAAGVVHRDLKPENIFLSEARNQNGDIVPKLLDFGVSKALAPGESHARLTGTGVAMGTPYYMSPEQIHSAADVGTEADIYSLGVIAYEALAGRLPFEGDTATAIIVKVATEEPDPLTELVPGLSMTAAHAVHRAMAKRGAERFATAGQFFSALASNGSGAVDFASTVEMEQFASTQELRALVLPQRSRLRMLVAVGVLGALSALALIGWLTWVAPGTPPAPSPVIAAPPQDALPPQGAARDRTALQAVSPEATPAGAQAAPAAEALDASPPSAAEALAPAAPSGSAASQQVVSSPSATGRTRPERQAHVGMSPSPAPTPAAATHPVVPPAATMTATPRETPTVGRLQTVVDQDSL